MFASLRKLFRIGYLYRCTTRRGRGSTDGTIEKQGIIQGYIY
ncbi:MAG: hypothetical protein OJF49_001243 [Ktedonobacterales bacterium]|nr:MAG: hypothetical protein OJF49_001243 [Ktedonobacterales bacterium]